MRYLLSSWIQAIFSPSDLFEKVNREEMGQKKALYFFLLISVIYKSLDFALIQGREPVEVVALTILVLLFSPIILHIATGIQYIFLWVIIDRDKGVDRTLRSIAYGSAPGLLAWIPFLGVVCFYGIFIQYIGIKQSHELTRIQGLVVSLPISITLYGYLFGGFDSLRKIYLLVIELI